MKHQNKIVGQRIVEIKRFDHYIVAILENGMSVEISDIATEKQTKDLIAEFGDVKPPWKIYGRKEREMTLREIFDLEKERSPMIGRK